MQSQDVTTEFQPQLKRLARSGPQPKGCTTSGTKPFVHRCDVVKAVGGFARPAAVDGGCGSVSGSGNGARSAGGDPRAALRPFFAQ